LLVVFWALLFFVGCQKPSQKGEDMLKYVRQAFETSAPVSLSPGLLKDSKNGWDVLLQAYDQGRLLFSVRAKADRLDEALRMAVEKAKAQNTLESGSIKRARLFLSVMKENQEQFSWVEYQGRALEIVGKDLVAVRSVDKAIIQEKIRAAKGYLLRAMDPDYHGFYKRYDALADKSEKRLRTIYSASSLWTLMKVYDWDADAEIAKRIPQIADFLLSMQVTEAPHAGAFYYSLSLKDGAKESSFVVGTASKTIFTLLELYRRFEDARYLQAAQKAGDWLLTTQKEDGTLTTSYRLKDSRWIEGKGFSTLYHGQVLSALSRLYRVTQDKKYLAAVIKLANLIMERARRQDYFLHDDYRLADDPIPTSWGIMSLLDYYKATSHPEAKDVLLKLTDQLVKRQFSNAEDILNCGRFEGELSSSGAGWINEVFSELYLYGIREGWNNADLMRIKQSILLVTRWLIQNTYSVENTYFLKNPQRAMGGLIRNFKEEAVRTDAVCHGVNGYVNMLDQWPEGTLLTVPFKKSRIIQIIASSERTAYVPGTD